ncbi:hypothetical protein BMWSH_1710 [Priestia megaterium WSH-002]|uniref:Uncharacterized protein n=1 Tax=Priestia megaterium (strain WSH-002) TaxID=1006007 RepID=A0A8D3X031_PRIMW|nr:hypothetical protein BMWSH_1710 [Priestia megaterium WSH-002]
MHTHSPFLVSFFFSSYAFVKTVDTICLFVRGLYPLIFC